jgi:hypothetical protein
MGLGFRFAVGQDVVFLTAEGSGFKESIYLVMD